MNGLDAPEPGLSLRRRGTPERGFLHVTPTEDGERRKNTSGLVVVFLRRATPAAPDA